MYLVDAIESIKYLISQNPHCGFYDYRLYRKVYCGTLENIVRLDFGAGDSDSYNSFVIRKMVYDKTGKTKIREERLSLQDLETDTWEFDRFYFAEKQKIIADNGTFVLADSAIAENNARAEQKKRHDIALEHERQKKFLIALQEQTDKYPHKIGNYYIRYKWNTADSTLDIFYRNVKLTGIFYHYKDWRIAGFSSLKRQVLKYLEEKFGIKLPKK